MIHMKRVLKHRHENMILVDPRLKGVSSMGNNDITLINKGIFTSCSKNNKCPPWQIQSNKIRHNLAKKTIYYDNAVLKVYDFPIFYFPKFFHPDPSVKRQSGFLMPTFEDSISVGSSFGVPYYHVLADNKDFTVKPRFYSDQKKILLQSEYRHVNKKSNHIVDFSYKISFFGQFFGIVLTSISFFFISKTFPMTNSIHLADFNYDYFMFATIGIAIIDMVISIMRSLTISLREAQTFGYDEILFISSVSPTYIFFCSSIYTFIKGTFKFIFYIFLLQLLGDYSFSISSILIAFCLFFVMIIPFLGLSFFGLSFVLFFKQADPVNFIINTVLSIFSGIIYPVSVLPTFMQTIV